MLKKIPQIGRYPAEVSVTGGMIRMSPSSLPLTCSVAESCYCPAGSRKYYLSSLSLPAAGHHSVLSSERAHNVPPSLGFSLKQLVCQPLARLWHSPPPPPTTLQHYLYCVPSYHKLTLKMPPRRLVKLSLPPRRLRTRSSMMSRGRS